MMEIGLVCMVLHLGMPIFGKYFFGVSSDFTNHGNHIARLQREGSVGSDEKRSSIKLNRLQLQ